MSAVRSPERLAAHVRLYDLALAIDPGQAGLLVEDVLGNLARFSPPLVTDAVLVSVLLGQYPSVVRAHSVVPRTTCEAETWAPVWRQVSELVPSSWSVMPSLMEAVALRAAGEGDRAAALGQAIYLEHLYAEDPGDGPCRWRPLGSLLCAYAVGEVDLALLGDLMSGAELRDAYVTEASQ